MRTPFVAGNWKMFKTVAETVKYVKEFRNLVTDIEDVLSGPHRLVEMRVLDDMTTPPELQKEVSLVPR